MKQKRVQLEVLSKCITGTVLMRLTNTKNSELSCGTFGAIVWTSSYRPEISLTFTGCLKVSPGVPGLGQSALA